MQYYYLHGGKKSMPPNKNASQFEKGHKLVSNGQKWEVIKGKNGKLKWQKSRKTFRLKEPLVKFKRGAGGKQYHKLINLVIKKHMGHIMPRVVYGKK